MGLAEITRNILLSQLHPALLSDVAPLLQPVDLLNGDLLHSPDAPITHAYFPLSGIASVIARSATNIQSEVGIIGREGFTGTALALAAETSPMEVVVQSPGRALRLEARMFSRLLEDIPAFRDVALRFIQAFMIQAAQTTVANTQYRLSQRLARWLLMCQDRSDSPGIAMTHEFLSTMLSVRRPGVTDALNELEGLHLVKNARGLVTVVDRSGLIDVAGGSYGVAEREYNRLFPQGPIAGG